jgi:hypothetical protein
MGTYPFSTTLPDRQGLRAVEKGYVPILAPAYTTGNR